MAAYETDAPTDISQLPNEQANRDQLRLVICGSAEDGKSTLLGRVLQETKTIFEDRPSAERSMSGKFGTQGDDVDPVLLVDGLRTKREPGVTIDTAYRYFETARRTFIAADTPDNEQYTRNMATGASTSELAVILVDARKGVLTQTRRHSYIMSLFGIRHVVLAINKMDLAGYDQAAFDAICAEYGEFATRLGLEDVRYVPLSALSGENVFETSSNMGWYSGPALMEILETIEIQHYSQDRAFRMPVHWVDRSSASFRGYCGTISSGSIRCDDRIGVYPSGATCKVRRILGPSGDLSVAGAQQSVTLVLDDEIDVSRGEMIADILNPPEISDQFAAHVIWFNSEPMLPERTYTIRFAAGSTTAQITDLVHRVDVNSMDQRAAKTLELNEAGYCKLALGRAIAFDPYRNNRQTGAFVLVDKLTNATVGAGVIDFGLRRASNIVWHDMKVSKAQRTAMNRHKPCIIWFTGLSGAGKSTIADRLEQRLFELDKRTYLLDGDNVRHGLNKDLGFTDQDRVENIRRVAETAKLMADAGLIVLVSFISPFRSERRMARSLMEDGEFLEVFVDTPLEVCEQRDPKGLYKKARSGQLKNFTGIDSTYEPPVNAEITLKAAINSVEDMVEQVITRLETEGRI